MFAWVSWHALGRAGGPRGVDQAQHVLGLDRAPGRLKVELRPPQRLELLDRERPRCPVGAVDDDHVLELLGPLARLQHRRQEGPLSDDHAVAGVGDHVLDLLGRGGVVDGEAGGAEVHRGGVGELEGRPVDEHEADRVASPDAERSEPGGSPAHPLGVLGEARLVVGVLEPQRRRLAPLGGGELECLAHRRGGQRSRPVVNHVRTL
jgi:hypothetical protein